MRSMTGYGRGECILYDRKFVVEIKAVNHRYNDITIKLPHSIISFEDTVKKILTSEIFRGKTDVFISFETYSKDDIKINLNEALADSYFDVLSKVKERYNLNDNINISMISRFQDVISVDKSIISAENDNKILEPLSNAAKQALLQFIQMRETEGEALKQNIISKIDVIYDYVKEIEKQAPTVVEEYRKKLVERLKEFQEISIDEARLLTEVTIFADRACIDEEVTRLFSHINQMKDILNETIPVGRKMDFLVQEINREINTIASKSNNLEITNITVKLKSEVEKIREQIQNIE